MVIGNEGEHKELGELVNRLRALQDKLRLPQNLLRVYEQAVDALSEVEAAIGSFTMPVAEVTHSLQFSPDTIGLITSIEGLEERYYQTPVLGLYFRALVAVFPAAAAQAAHKFNYDALAVVEAADKFLKTLLKNSMDGYYYGLDRWQMTFTDVMHKVQEFGVKGLEQIALEACRDVISKSSVEEAYKFSRAQEQIVIQQIGSRGGLYGMLRTGAFLYIFHDEPQVLKPVTAEEKLAYSLLGNAIAKGYEFFSPK